MGIIQARMGATRLPNKMMLWLHGHPIIEWVVRRAGAAQKLDGLLVAVPEGDGDDVLASYLVRQGVSIFRGSEKDVVDRFYQAARSVGATHVVRICADNPLICGTEIDHLIDYYFAKNYDYVYNHIPKNNSYPDGYGAEIISFEILERIWKESVKPEHREHLLNYIWDNPNAFSIATFDPPDVKLARPDVRLDIDRMADYAMMLAKPLRIDMGAREILEVWNEGGGHC
ncbi:MAG TPA: NTP transferase domain-containing protein [Candidatus Ozemobacteraceae bacterium]